MEQDVTSLILETAEKRFGITAVKPFQLLVMQRIIEQETLGYSVRHQIVILPTGTGKSLCFLLPATLCSGITVIVYPLLALMNDQIAKLKANNIEAACLRGGQTKQVRNEQFEKLKSSCKILITNPETLCNEKILRHLKSFHFSLFVCDEAHVISQWGKTFRPAYLGLNRAVRELNPYQILAFTATAGDQTIADIRACIFPSKPLVVRGDSDRENIFYGAYRCADRETGLFSILAECEKPAIVFVNKRRDTMKLCVKGLRMMPYLPQRYYNAGLTKPEREALETWFLDSKDGILYTTNAYGMGIDKPDIRTVVHYRAPESAEAYLQESGRAGRDGKQAVALCLITGREKASQISRVFTSDGCRRKALLQLLGQNKTECTGCDWCTSKVPYRRRTDLIEKSIIRAVKYHPFKYSGKTLSLILCYEGRSAVIKTDRWAGVLKGTDRDLVENTITRLTGSKLGCIKLPARGQRLYYRYLRPS